MKFIFVLLFSFPIISLAQRTGNTSRVQKSYLSAEPKRIFFSELSRLNQLHPDYKAISGVRVLPSDTSLFSLYVSKRIIYCLPDSANLQTTEGIDGRVNFTLCHFQDIQLEDKVFMKEASFKFCVFDSASSFFKVVFNQDVFFSSSIFQNGHVFNNCQFKNNVKFDQITSIQNFVFKSIEFEKEVSFRGADFSKGLMFYKTTFNSTPDFTDIQLPDNLVFDDVSFKYNQLADQNIKIDFSSSKLDSLRSYIKYPAKCMFQARLTDINKFILPYDRFWLVFYDDATYEEKISAYESIINSCREAGLKESVEGWDIEYRELQNKHKFGFSGLLINLFNKCWWNFGYDKWMILVIWLPFFFACFMIYNLFNIERLWRSMYQDNELGKVFNKRKVHAAPPRKFGGEKFAFVFFYTAVIYFGFKIRHEAVNYKNTRGLLYLYLMYAVGTIHIAFAFGYILNAY